MDQREEFERLKERMLKSYADYMDVIRNTSYDDLDNFKVRKRLIEAFARSVQGNTDYRNFITRYKDLNTLYLISKSFK
jgi:hypothetical protein